MILRLTRPQNDELLLCRLICGKRGFLFLSIAMGKTPGKWFKTLLGKKSSKSTVLKENDLLV